jgi:FtsZ-interacting cell division protein YlmF
MAIAALDRLKDSFIGSGRSSKIDEEADVMNNPSIFTNDDGLKNMATCKPETFHDVDKILSAFKESVPVILLLRKVKSTQHRQRIIDFCYGLVKGLDGRMESVDTDVFVLTPYDYASVVDVLGATE